MLLIWTLFKLLLDIDKLAWKQKLQNIYRKINDKSLINVHKLWKALKQFFLSLQQRKTLHMSHLLWGRDWTLFLAQTSQRPLTSRYVTKWTPIFWSLFESGTENCSFRRFTWRGVPGVLSWRPTFGGLRSVINYWATLLWNSNDLMFWLVIFRKTTYAWHKVRPTKPKIYDATISSIFGPNRKLNITYLPYSPHPYIYIFLNHLFVFVKVQCHENLTQRELTYCPSTCSMLFLVKTF